VGLGGEDGGLLVASTKGLAVAAGVSFSNKEDGKGFPLEFHLSLFLPLCLRTLGLGGVFDAADNRLIS